MVVSVAATGAVPAARTTTAASEAGGALTDVLPRLALASLLVIATIGTGACDSEFLLAGFTADEAFADPEVERFARAAVLGDLPEMEAAVAAGADVDYQGEQKMTPLA